MHNCPHCHRPVALTAEERAEIRNAPTGQVRALAKKFGVDRRTIQRERQKIAILAGTTVDNPS